MGEVQTKPQIAKKLDLGRTDVQKTTTQLREGVVKKSQVTLESGVKCDEVYIVSGHKGNQKGRENRRNRIEGTRVRGTLKKEKPPVF